MSLYLKPEVIQFVIAGPPGSGKSTMSLKMVEEYGFKHVSAGDCLREEMANENSVHRELIKTYIEAGKIIPVEVTAALLIKKMESFGLGKEIVIIDGFPRNDDNVRGWVEQLSPICELIHLITFNCPIEICEERIMGRTKECERTDNASHAIRNRVKVFFDDTMPIVRCVMMAGKCSIIDATGTKDEVWKGVVELLTKLGFKAVQK